MKLNALLFAVLNLSVVSVAQAEVKTSGFYVGGAIGSTGIDASSDISINADGLSYKFIGGYQFNRIVGIEAQYTSYGDINLPADKNTWSASSIAVTANLGYTFDSGLRPYGLIGLSSINLNEQKETLVDDQGIALRAGLGIEYAPAMLNGLAFRLGYEMDYFGIQTQYSLFGSTVTEDVTYGISSLNLGATYKF
ncbi:porin family protein [Photobacterium sanguinicancri]|uniref:porin family protein n=1 Tax=Photobacterium sanguinicancri TaxID=875932 RepID=UPI003D09F556